MLPFYSITATIFQLHKDMTLQMKLRFAGFSHLVLIPRTHLLQNFQILFQKNFVTGEISKIFLLNSGGALALDEPQNRVLEPLN